MDCLRPMTITRRRRKYQLKCLSPCRIRYLLKPSQRTTSRKPPIYWPELAEKSLQILHSRPQKHSPSKTAFEDQSKSDQNINPSITAFSFADSLPQTHHRHEVQYLRSWPCRPRDRQRPTSRRARSQYPPPRPQTRTILHTLITPKPNHLTTLPAHRTARSPDLQVRM